MIFDGQAIKVLSKQQFVMYTHTNTQRQNLGFPITIIFVHIRINTNILAVKM